MQAPSVALLGFALLLVGLFGGCDRRVEPFVPADQEPPPPERPVRIPGLEKPKPPPSGAFPGSGPAPRRAPEAAVSGTVRLPEGTTVSGDPVLYVIARDPDGGPPLAAKRLPGGPFPVAFTLGPGQLMGDGRPFTGPMRISARLDHDGDPLTRGPDDMVGELAEAVDAGRRGLEIVLRREMGGPGS